VTTYGIASLVCNYAANDTNPSQDGDYSTGTYQCIGFPGTYGYTFYNNVNDKGPVVTLTAQSPLIQGRVINAVQPEQSSYGLVLYGSLYYTEFSASPISWFVVDSTSTRNQLQNASTHEQLRSVELQDGSALGGLLRPKQFVDLSTTPLAWTGQAFTGDLTSYPINSDPSWRGRVKVNDPLLAEYDVHYISDWGRTSFCAQQAARYGITV
jgi:hypothetical protein